MILQKNFSNLKVILVEPNGPLNVGSVARLCSNFEVEELRIDGGLSNNLFFNQLLSNVIQLEVLCSKTIESTALGAAFLAGIGSGEVSLEDISNNWIPRAQYEPNDDYDFKRYDIWRGYLEKLIGK